MVFARAIRHRGFPLIPFVRLASTSPLCLVPIGQAQSLKESPYEPGQLILHRHFGYRGVILQAWSARLFDKNVVLNTDPTDSFIHTTHQSIDEAPMPTPPLENGRSIYAYTVMLDSQDAQLCNSSLLPGISFLPDDESLFNTLYMMSDMDYAFHDDLIPYTCKNPVPMKNECFKQFLHFDPHKEPHFSPTGRLQRWLEMRRPCLAVKALYRETTEGVRVTAVPFFMGRRNSRYSEETPNFYWRYLIRLENLTDECLQLRERFWKIFSINGSLESMSGKGIVGMQPLLSVHSPVFQYHSHVQVPVPWAHMWGQFRLEKRNGATIDVKIPVFPLCDKSYREDDNDTSTDNSTDNTK